MAFEPNMSEDPKALEGAAEWAKAELDKIEKEEAASKIVYERIRPLREEAFRKIHEREKLTASN